MLRVLKIFPLSDGEMKPERYLRDIKDVKEIRNFRIHLNKEGSFDISYLFDN